MGIPQLIATLEPYATHAILQDVNVVIDGPGLAHHILHVCRVNGIDQPSYEQLGKAVISWLDKLASQNVAVEQLYFDGFLPSHKLPVRMSRTLKSTSQINVFYNNNTGGCPRAHISENKSGRLVDAFLTGRIEKKPFAAPSFLVPAIIDALRTSPKYSSLVCMVPGEADGYCASHAARTGATVLTSDSDLLVHNIGSGSVALLRDIYRVDDAVVRCSIYTPDEIFPRLGLTSTSDVHRFAYERWRATHATVTSLVRACEEPVSDEDEYQEFRVQYLSEDEADGSTPALGENLSIQNLDPRFCEVLLQLSTSGNISKSDESAKIFLPILIENPDRGTAWEQSTPIRRLAYSIARRMIPGCTSTIQEYRRVQNLDQKGRQVPVLPQKDMVSSIDDLAQVMAHLSRQTKARGIPFWPMLYIVLDTRECFAQGKDSHVLSTALQLSSSRWPHENAHRVPWDFMHFVAQLQAAYYSLRLLRQVLNLSVPGAEKVADNNLQNLITLVSEMPELKDSPSIENTLEFLRANQADEMRGVLSDFVDLPDARRESKRRAKKHKKGDDGVEKRVTKPEPSKVNMFDMLPME